MSDSERSEGSSGRAFLPTTSTSLVDGLKCCDERAWQRMTALYGPFIYQRCRRAGLAEYDADEVVQEVFQAVMKSIGRFRRDGPNVCFRKWLNAIVTSKIRDYFRHHDDELRGAGGSEAHARLQQIAEQDPDTQTSDDGATEGWALERRAVELVRGRVGERTWKAFWLVTAGDRTIADVADELGVSRHAVYDANYRVRRLVLEEFSDLLDS